MHVLTLDGCDGMLRERCLHHKHNRPPRFVKMVFAATPTSPIRTSIIKPHLSALYLFFPRTGKSRVPLAHTLPHFSSLDLLSIDRINRDLDIHDHLCRMDVAVSMVAASTTSHVSLGRAKVAFIQAAIDNGVLLFGDFILKSVRYAPGILTEFQLKNLASLPISSTADCCKPAPCSVLLPRLSRRPSCRPGFPLSGTCYLALRTRAYLSRL